MISEEKRYALGVEKFQSVPMLIGLISEEKRHNQWKGLFGRLDREGNFPTSITDPQPMGTVGMCFHPDQDRIIIVREWNIHNKHRQIGNSVPPPLAFALGWKLEEAVDKKQSTQQE